MIGSGEPPLATFAFEADVFHWRGPSPYFFVALPPAEAEEVRRLSRIVTYGWGMIPAVGEVAGVAFTTALFRKDETYYVPLKDAVRHKAGVTAGDRIAIQVAVQPPKR
ncbi:MAG: DUF1905 domain-containing protein [Phenylobacterium zucineum]|nr:MAG: DUF1905 domain-containing protein [Phenylobacterium zucineum]